MPFFLILFLPFPLGALDQGSISSRGMDEDGKKRKAAPEDNRQQEEEEAKMEEFFALIRSTRDIQERLTRSRSVLQESSNPNQREPTVWTPRFEPEDFAGGGGPSGSSPHPPPVSEGGGGHSKEDAGGEREEGMQQEDTTELNLKLSL